VPPLPLPPETLDRLNAPSRVDDQAEAPRRRTVGFVWRSDWDTMTVHRCGVFIRVRGYPIKLVWGVW
jgi:hypothetical protein